MCEMDNEEFEEFIKRNIDNLHNAFKVNCYEELVQYNRYIISHIRYSISGHLVGILMNKNYYHILNKLHKVSVTLKGGKIDIDNFTVLLGIDNDQILDQSVHIFNCDIYDNNKLVLPLVVKIKYDDKSTASILTINSELLYEKLYVDDYKMEDLVDNDNMEKMRVEALNKNNKLISLSNIIDRLIDPQDTAELISRPVIYYKEGGEDKDEE